MSVSLPDIEPTRRRFEPGEWAVKRYNSMSGAGHSRLYGSRPFDATFDLEYICDDIYAETFIQAWHQSKGGYYDISIPRGLVAGMKTQLVWVLPQNLSWRFESRPSIESMRPDVNRVRVRLIGRLESERQGVKKVLPQPVESPPPAPPPTPTPRPTPAPTPAPTPGPTPTPTPTPTATPAPTPTPAPSALFDTNLPDTVPAVHKGYILTAMENLSKYIALNPGNTNGPITLGKFEVTNRAAVAWCYYGYSYYKGTHEGKAYVNCRSLSLGVNPTYEFDENTWVNVWQHEICHGLGISWWLNSVSDISGHMGMDQADGPSKGYVYGTNYPEALTAYAINSGTVDPDVIPLRGNNHGHWIMADRNITPTGYSPKNYKLTMDVMAKALKAGSLLTNVTLMTLKQYGYVITPLPDDPPNPFPTTVNYKADAWCGCCNPELLQQRGILDLGRED